MISIEDKKIVQEMYISSLQYRGNDIFSLLLKEDVNDEMPSYSINLIGCFGLQDDGVVGSVIKNIDLILPSMRYIFIAQKFSIDHKNYREVRIENIDGIKLDAIIEKVVVSDSIQLYNPISEDKY